MTTKKDLFSPVEIGSLVLKNRLVRSATAERLASHPIGRATPPLAALYRELAEGGVGLTITGHAFVAPEGRAHPEMMGAHCDELIEGLQTLAQATHDAGGRVAMQINHGGRQSDWDTIPDVIAPSPVPTPSGNTPREMTSAEVDSAVDAYGQAARRAQIAGFDGVQIHSAHGYLISQFLSPHTNRRRDAWGGDFARRTAFLAAVCEAVRGQVGRDYPVFIKLGMADNLEQVPDGLTLDDGARVVSQLAAFGLDGVEVSGGDGGQSDFVQRMGVGTRAPEAYFREFSQRAKAVTDLPVILVGGLRSRSMMDEVLASGDADLLAICRPLIREPDLPKRIQSGETAVAACISGGRCWPKGMGQGISCKCEG